MPGFSTITAAESVMFADNASFDGTKRGGTLDTNGQMWIGNASAPQVRKGILTSPDNSITVGYSAPNITLEVNTSVVTDLHVTPYIVSPNGIADGANFTTIQSAIDAATMAGGGIIYIQPGTYVENITMTELVQLVGWIGSNGNMAISIPGELDLPVIIQGNFTLDLTGAVSIPSLMFQNIQFTADSGIIFTYTGSGLLLESGYINFNNCKFVAGTSPTYVFSNDGFFNINLQSCVVDEASSSGTDFITWGATPFLNLNIRDSWININATNALVIPDGAFNVFTFQTSYWGARLDASTGTQSLNIRANQCTFSQDPALAGDPLINFGSNSGSLVANNCVILSASGSLVNSTAASAADVFKYNNCIWNNPLTLGTTGRGEFSFCEFYGGSSAAITFSSSQNVSIHNSIINSSNNPAIDGAGAGILTLGSITYSGNSNVAGTLTISGEPLIFSGNNLLTGTARSGNSNIHTITNPSNTASSNASQLITVGGTSAGNPYTQWAVGTTRAWALGIENSASQRMTLSMDAAGTVTPGGGNYIYSATPGATSFLSSFTFWVPQVAVGGLSNPGGGVNLNIANTSATASSDAFLSIQVNNGGGAGGGNSYVSYTGPANNWWHGVNKTAGAQAWQLQTATIGNFPTANTVINATTAGNLTYPLQCAFYAYLSATVTNVTGNGNVYTVAWNSTIVNRQSAFSTGTNTFTAPVTGEYAFQCGLSLQDIAVNHISGFALFNTSNRAYAIFNLNPSIITVAPGTLWVSNSILADMDAADTVAILLVVSGGALAVDVGGGSSGPTSSYFSGNLQC